MKIAIIGGGINGLYLAWKLAKKGEKITLFERKREIGNKVCSGLFSERILDFIPESKKLIENKINFVLIHFPKKTIRVNFSKSFFLMSHYKLDNLVADLAQKAGVEIVLNRNISSIPKGFEKIIACDGASSIIRKTLKLPEPNYRLGILGFDRNQKSDNFIETWPTKNGFIWKIPKEENTEYGIIEDPLLARKIFDKFLKKRNLKLIDVQSKIIPQGLIIPKNKKITLCGDAAGLTKPWSGGGVIWGMKAANILLKSFPDFLTYRKKMRRFFMPKIVLSKIATKLAYFFGFNFPWIIPKNIKIESDFLL